VFVTFRFLFNATLPVIAGGTVRVPFDESACASFKSFGLPEVGEGILQIDKYIQDAFHNYGV
jgi:hypothetical protein